MISPKRMVEIFRRRGGGKFADLSKKLTPEQFAYLGDRAGGEPIIAMMPSADEWFVLTQSQLILSRAKELQKVPVDEICAVEISRLYLRDVRKFEHIKKDGGFMDITQRDGATLQIKVEPGGPYLGLMNVLMRIATINRRRNAISVAGGESVPPTTNDRRLTTQS